MSRPSVFDEEETTLRVSEHPNVLMDHLGAPNPSNQKVAKELQVRDVEVVEVRRWGNRNVLMEPIMISSDSRGAAMPSIGGGIQRNVGCGVVDQEGHTISDSQSFQPPLNVVAEGLIEVDLVGELGGSSFSCQNAIDEQSTGKQHICCIEKFSG